MAGTSPAMTTERVVVYLSSVMAGACRPSRSGTYRAPWNRDGRNKSGHDAECSGDARSYSLVKQPAARAANSVHRNKTKLRRPRLRPCAGKHVIFRSFRPLLNEKGSMERRKGATS